MISLELLVIGADSLTLDSKQIGLEVDKTNRSDRNPSLWQRSIINNNRGILVHIFDLVFKRTNEQRWLYEDINTDDWEYFRFNPKKQEDFTSIVEVCLRKSPESKIWIMTDAQFGPSPQIEKSSYIDFLDTYHHMGLRINCAVLLSV